MFLPFMGLAQVKETVLRETFDSNSAGWPEDVTDDYTARFIKGYYLLEHKRDIETEGACGESSAADGGYGIVWGKGRGGYFSFAITPGGRFFVRKMVAGREGKYLLGPKTDTIINKLVVDKNDKSRRFYACLCDIEKFKPLSFIRRRLLHGNRTGHDLI